MATISRRAYADMYGPTLGDRIRLADTGLVIEIERDHAIHGEEVKFVAYRKSYGNQTGETVRSHPDTSTPLLIQRKS